MNYPKAKCATVIRALTRDGNDDLIPMLGLTEQAGLNTRKDAHSVPTPAVRKPLWLEQVVGHLSTGHMQKGL